MKKILALLAALALALVGTIGAAVTPAAAPGSNPLVEAAGKLLAPAPAAAAWGTAITHAADDAGYAGNIHIVCNDGTHMFLAPGQTTFLAASGGCSLSGVDRIVVPLNQTVYCKNYAPPYENTYYYSFNANNVPSNRTYKCYAQRPL